MKKSDDEIPTPNGGLTDTGHTLFEQGAKAELEKTALRLHYSKDAFKLGNVLDGDEPGSKVVIVWCLEKHTIRVTVPMDNSAAFAKALEAKLKEQDEYRERFEQDDDTVS